MGQELKEIIRSASKLPEKDRAMLAGLLIASLEPEMDPRVEAAWREEIRRRADEIDSGKVELVPWETLRNEMFARVNEG